MENSTTTPKCSEDTVVLDLSPGTLQNLAAGFPVDIQLEPPIEPLQDALQQGSSEGTVSQHTGSSEYSQDIEYQPSDADSDSDLDAFQSPPKKKQKKIDGHQKWNGTIKQPLPDEEFAKRMHNIRKFLLDGKEPEGIDQKAHNKFRHAAHNKYTIKEGKLFFNTKSGELEVVCDKKEQFRIMKCIHSGIGASKESRALGGHLRRNTLQTEIASRYYWPCVTADVKKFIRSCKECQCSKLSNLEKTK